MQKKEGLGKYFFKTLFSILTLLKWLLISSLIGLFVGAVGSLFGRTLLWANDFRKQNPWIILALPIAGLLIVFLYRFFKNT